MTPYMQLATDQSLELTKKALEQNGFNVLIANSSKDAVTAIEKLIPVGSEVMDNTSKTLDDTGIRELLHSDKYNSVHQKMLTMDRDTEARKMQEMRSVNDYAIGSVHAVTQDGKIMIASGTGSQLPAYAFGAKNVVLVAGTNKIVKNLDDGYNRIYTHSLPLESIRVQSAYGMPHSNVRRILIMNSEASPRTTILLVKENLGF